MTSFRETLNGLFDDFLARKGIDFDDLGTMALEPGMTWDECVYAFDSMYDGLITQFLSEDRTRIKAAVDKYARQVLETEFQYFALDDLFDDNDTYIRTLRNRGSASRKSRKTKATPPPLKSKWQCVKKSKGAKR